MDDPYRGGTAPDRSELPPDVYDMRQVQSAGLDITEQHNGHYLLPEGHNLPTNDYSDPTPSEMASEGPGYISTAPATLGGDSMNPFPSDGAPDSGESAETSDNYGAESIYARMQRRPMSQPVVEMAAQQTGSPDLQSRQLLDMDGLKEVIRQVVQMEVPNGLSALQTDVLELHEDMQAMQKFVMGTGQREEASKSIIVSMNQKLEDQWEGWKQRIAELRNAILEHPNVDSSALGVFDRDALEDAIESSRMATIVGQEAKAEGTRVSKVVSEFEERILEVEGKIGQVKGPDAETQALTARLKRDVEVILQKSEALATSNDELQKQVHGLLDSNLLLRNEVQDLKKRLETAEVNATHSQQKVEERYGALNAMVETAQSAAQQVGTDTEKSMEVVKEDLQKLRHDLSEAHRLAAVVGPHTMDVLRGELEGLSAKVDQVQASVPSAVAPVQERMKAVQDTIHQLQTTKLDAADSVTQPMLEKSVATAVDSADRKVNLVMSALSSIEERIEDLTIQKVDREVVAMKTELDDLGGEINSVLDQEIKRLSGNLTVAMTGKVDTAALSNSEKKASQRISQLEGAILRGLKAVSDRVAAALLEKADTADLNDFRMQMRGILSEVDLRLREISPSARLMASGPNARATHCMSCDQQVRPAKEAIAAGNSVYGLTGTLPPDEKVFPSKLPAMKQWHNSYSQASDVDPRGAANNAKMAQKRYQRESLMRSSGGKSDLAEDMMDYPPLQPSPTVPSQARVRGDSVSGGLSKNLLPPTRRSQGVASSSEDPLSTSGGPAASRVVSGRPGLEVSGFSS